MRELLLRLPSETDRALLEDALRNAFMEGWRRAYGEAYPEVGFSFREGPDHG